MRRGSSGIRAGDTAQDAAARIAALEERLATMTATVERQHRLLQALPAAADVALVAVDDAGTCSVLGDRHRDLLAELYARAGEDGREVGGVIFDADGVRELTESELPSVRAARGEVVDHLRVWVGREPESRRPFTVSACAVRDEHGAVRGALLAYRDVDELFQVQQLHDLFLRSMSHELRTPLASVLGRLELLAERGDLPSDVSRLVFGAHRNAERLGRLVADLLEVVEVRDGSLSLELGHDDVAALARGVVDAAQQAAVAAGVTVHYEGPDRLGATVDGLRFRQAVEHLVGNAVKFTDPGGAVTVRLGRGQDEIHVEVVDTGVGIDAAETDLVFGRFFRGRAAHQRAAAGTGIGLWLVRNVAEGHGGSVEITHTTHTGTVMRMGLPDRAEHLPGVTVGSPATGVHEADTLWRHSADAAWVDRDDRVMALDLARPGARPQALEGVAAIVWRLLEQPRSIEDLLRELRGSFTSAVLPQMRHDLEQFLSDLAAAGLAAPAER